MTSGAWVRGIPSLESDRVIGAGAGWEWDQRVHYDLLASAHVLPRPADNCGNVASGQQPLVAAVSIVSPKAHLVSREVRLRHDASRVRMTHCSLQRLQILDQVGRLGGGRHDGGLAGVRVVGRDWLAGCGPVTSLRECLLRVVRVFSGTGQDAVSEAIADVLTLKGASYRLRGRGIDSLPSIRTTTPETESYTPRNVHFQTPKPNGSRAPSSETPPYASRASRVSSCRPRGP